MNVCSGLRYFLGSSKTHPHLRSRHHSRLNLSDHSVRRVAGDDLRVVQHVELLCRIAARVEQDRLLASWVIRQEGRDIEHLAINHDPDVVLLVVLRDLLGGVRASA